MPNQWLKHQGLQESQLWKREEEKFPSESEMVYAALLDRMGGTSARYGLSARVPFADYRIVEYCGTYHGR